METENTIEVITDPQAIHQINQSEARILAKKMARDRIDYLRSLYDEHESGYNKYIKLLETQDKKTRQNAIVEYTNIKALSVQWYFLNPDWRVQWDNKRLSVEELVKGISQTLQELKKEAEGISRELEIIDKAYRKVLKTNNVIDMQNIRAGVERFKFLNTMWADDTPFDFNLVDKDLPNTEALILRIEELDNVIKEAESKISLYEDTIDKEQRQTLINDLHNIREYAKMFIYQYAYKDFSGIDFSNVEKYKNVRELKDIEADIKHFETLQAEAQSELIGYRILNNVNALINCREYANNWLKNIQVKFML